MQAQPRTLLQRAEAAGSWQEGAPSGAVRGFQGFGGPDDGAAPVTAVALAGPSPGRVVLGAGGGGSGSWSAHTTAVTSATAADMVRGNWEETPLSRAFFSAANVAIVQNLLRFRVHARTGRVIDQQSTEELLTVMRATFLQDAKHAGRVADQVVDLNERVAAWAVPRIVAEMGMYDMYLRDISRMPTPMAHPVLLTAAGSRGLEMRPPGL